MVDRRRHLAKAVTYRVFGSAVTAGIAYFISGDVKIGAGVGIADTVLKIGLYYMHERVWYRVRWGVHADRERVRGPEIVITTDGREAADRSSGKSAAAGTGA